jgi:hypothetical protein
MDATHAHARHPMHATQCTPPMHASAHHPCTGWRPLPGRAVEALPVHEQRLMPVRGEEAGACAWGRRLQPGHGEGAAACTGRTPLLCMWKPQVAGGREKVSFTIRPYHLPLATSDPYPDPKRTNFTFFQKKWSKVPKPDNPNWQVVGKRCLVLQDHTTSHFRPVP